MVYMFLVQEVDGLPASGGPGMDQLTRRTSLRVTSGGIAVPMANGNVMMLPLPEEIEEEGGGGGQTSPVGGGQNYGTDINITEEVNRSGVWTSLEGNQNKGGGAGNKQDKK